MWAAIVLRVRHADGVREEERYVGLCPLVRHRKMVKGTPAWCPETHGGQVR